VKTVLGTGLDAYTKYAVLEQDKLQWIDAFNTDDSVLRNNQDPFSSEGGVKLLQGNLGRSVSKISAIAEEYRYVKAVAAVFHSQEDVVSAYKAGKLNRDVIVVLKYQGPRANGMPELHALTPALLSLQDKGFHVALVTDGRMSGASGKVPNAIHITPEALSNVNLAKVQDGDIIELDLNNGILQLHVSDEVLANRVLVEPDLSANQVGFGRELFNNLRVALSESERGATLF
jgi:phosphogluconate dehydratase